MPANRLRFLAEVFVIPGLLIAGLIIRASAAAPEPSRKEEFFTYPVEVADKSKGVMSGDRMPTFPFNFIGHWTIHWELGRYVGEPVKEAWMRWDWSPEASIELGDTTYPLSDIRIHADLAAEIDRIAPIELTVWAAVLDQEQVLAYLPLTIDVPGRAGTTSMHLPYCPHWHDLFATTPLPRMGIIGFQPAVPAWFPAEKSKEILKKGKGNLTLRFESLKWIKWNEEGIRRIAREYERRLKKENQPEKEPAKKAPAEKKAHDDFWGTGAGAKSTPGKEKTTPPADDFWGGSALQSGAALPVVDIPFGYVGTDLLKRGEVARFAQHHQRTLDDIERRRLAEIQARAEAEAKRRIEEAEARRKAEEALKTPAPSSSEPGLKLTAWDRCGQCGRTYERGKKCSCGASGGSKSTTRKSR